MSPCNVICSACGGRGYRKFWDLRLPFERAQPDVKECQDCSGEGYISEKTFKEREILFRRWGSDA